MSFDLILKNAVNLHEQGQLDEAEKYYRQLLEMSPEHTDLLHLLGMIAMQKGSFDSAIDLLYKAVRLNSENVMYRFTLAQALSESGRFKESIEYYNQILKKDSTIAEVYHNLGVVYRSLGEIQQAKDNLNKSLELKPDFASAYINLALIVRDEKQYDSALALLKNAEKIDSDNAEVYAQFGVTYRLMQDYETALDFYEKALEINKNHPLYWNGIGITYERLNRLDEAFEAYDLAIQIDDKFSDAYNNRANVLVKQGKDWDAEQDYRKAVKLDPEYASAFNNLGALLYAKGLEQEALECYRKAFIINPKQAETCANLAVVVKDTGDLAEAIGLYFNALALDSSLVENHYFLAQALYELYSSNEDEAKDTAVKLAKKWLSFFPENEIAKHTCKALEGGSNQEITQEYVSEMFDAFASTFEVALKKINYQLPEILAEEIKFLPTDLKILDAGCGTGLCASALKQYAKTLIGVDLSEKMLEKARYKQLYDVLECCDINNYLSENTSTFDCVVFADVLCYFSQLNVVFKNAFSALVDGGWLIFSVEQSIDKDFFLKPSGRIGHKKEYVQGALEQAGFKNSNIKEMVLRLENNDEIKGFFVIVQKTK